MKFDFLIIDDEEIICDGLSRVLKKEGYQVDYTTDNENALKIIKEKEYDIILLDINLSGKSGIDLLPEIKLVSPDSLIIMITAYNDVFMAVETMKAGAHDYFVKSSEYDELLIKIEKALEIQKLRRNVNRFQESLFREYNIDRFIGTDPNIRQLFKNVRKIAQTPDTTVLVTGESGTGKELIAKSIHYISDRKNNPFIAVNCASISPGLCESEIFGHESGAFTDAKKDKKGVFELAEDGTLFLDEISSMNLDLQGSLLRVLEEKKFRRLGGTREINVNVRVISATNKNLEELVKGNKFREDLFFRLNLFQIKLPPLRERKSDIIDLALFFIESFSKTLGENIKEIDPKARTILCNYNYPGNVRELRNIIERAMILSDGNKITPHHLTNITTQENEIKDGLRDEKIISLKEMERIYIIKVLKLCNGNKTEAARRLRIARSTLNLQIKEIGMIRTHPEFHA